MILELKYVCDFLLPRRFLAVTVRFSCILCASQVRTGNVYKNGLRTCTIPVAYTTTTPVINRSLLLHKRNAYIMRTKKKKKKHVYYLRGIIICSQIAARAEPSDRY
jgi:hypothetical protein